MSNTKANPEQLAQTINKLQINLKAEVIGSLLSNIGIDKTSIQSNYTSSFNRSYRNDTYKAKYNSENDTLDLFISRNGLYDMLPEGLFHPEIIENNKKISVKNLLESHKKQKKEESEARLFFKPFENHIFQFFIKIEDKEKNLINNSHEFRSFFMQFWGLESWIKDEQFVFMLHILPYSKNIKGNINRITQLLSHHLQKEISFNRGWKEIHLSKHTKQQDLILGQNFIIGNTSDQLPCIEFNIYNISDQELHEYSKNGYYYKFISLYFEYLLPIELEYEINIKPNYKQAKNNFGILGHSTTLQILKN